MDILESLIAKHTADVFFLSGPIDYSTTESLIDYIATKKQRENLLLILCTPGGDANAGYTLVRYLRRAYKQFNLLVYGYCKSAGTLIAIGADRIIMAPRAEFGPLDVQLTKDDEITSRTSGLDITTALESLTRQAFQIFETHFIEIKQRSYGAITTKTAADISTAIAIGLLAPITQQIDPLKLGETQRAIAIASQYGRRLGGSDRLIQHLIHHYPSHDFVIDVEEAKKWFQCVEDASDVELQFGVALQASLIEQFGEDFLRFPHTSGISLHLEPPPKKSHATPPNPSAPNAPSRKANGNSTAAAGSTHPNPAKPGKRNRKPRPSDKNPAKKIPKSGV